MRPIAIATLAMVFTHAIARADSSFDPRLTPVRSTDKPIPAGAKPLAPSTSISAPAKKLGPRHWYGWQVMAADAPVWIATWKAMPANMALLGTGPIVHLLNGEDERAQASLAVRLVGAMFGAGISGVVLFDRDCGTRQTTCPPGMTTVMKGAAIGLALAEIVDIAVVSWTSTADGDEALPPLVARRTPAPPTSGALLLGSGQVGFSVSGSF